MSAYGTIDPSADALGVAVSMSSHGDPVGVVPVITDTYVIHLLLEIEVSYISLRVATTAAATALAAAGYPYPVGRRTFLSPGITVVEREKESTWEWPGAMP